jgi:pyruvate dehydrogenase E1 component alpha subunit
VICRDTLISWGVFNRARADSIEAAAKQEAIEAFAWAAQQPVCKPEDGLRNVFVEGTVIPRQFG